MNRKPPFHSLRNPDLAKAFDEDLLALLSELDYSVMTVVIDKQEHLARYRTWRFDPYHYCLTVLVERYALWLRRSRSVGDVMAESRGGREDRRLKASFEGVVQSGSEFILPDVFEAHLTSRQLKVRSKTNNVSGLQLADVIAHPSFRAAVARKNGDSLPDNLGGRIASILERSKYHRGPGGRIEGWGRKWLP